MTQLNSQKLAAYVRTKRANKSLRDIADLLENVSISTLSRVENGKSPDIKTYLALCDWLEVSPQWFFEDIVTRVVASDVERIEHALRADEVLSSDFVDAFMHLVQLMHRDYAQRKWKEM